MSSQIGRSDSPGLDAFALSKLLWSDDSEDEVEEHILTNDTTFDLVSGTRKDTEDGTDNPDENEVDGLIDTFDVGLPERSFGRVSSWRAGVLSGDFDFVNQVQGRPLSPFRLTRLLTYNMFFSIVTPPSPSQAEAFISKSIRRMGVLILTIPFCTGGCS
jgi:hypothetical protein